MTEASGAGTCSSRTIARYPDFMTTQQTDVSDLAVLAGSAQQWSPGTPQEGVDDRVELARMSAAARVAVREARHPNGPALLFDLPDWQALVGVRAQPQAQPELVDLRSVEVD
jgi:hypothetical protein